MKNFNDCFAKAKQAKAKNDGFSKSDLVTFAMHYNRNDIWTEIMDKYRVKFQGERIPGDFKAELFARYYEFFETPENEIVSLFKAFQDGLEAIKALDPDLYYDLLKSDD